MRQPVSSKQCRLVHPSHLPVVLLPLKIFMVCLICGQALAPHSYPRWESILQPLHEKVFLFYILEVNVKLLVNTLSEDETEIQQFVVVNIFSSECLRSTPGKSVYLCAVRLTEYRKLSFLFTDENRQKAWNTVHNQEASNHLECRYVRNFFSAGRHRMAEHQRTNRDSAE